MRNQETGKIGRSKEFEIFRRGFTGNVIKFTGSGPVTKTRRNFFSLATKQSIHHWKRRIARRNPLGRRSLLLFFHFYHAIAIQIWSVSTAQRFAGKPSTAMNQPAAPSPPSLLPLSNQRKN
ncbi:hypothetical protein FXO38_04673 [Capsicum annuum]|nr:hypothetical protein FXO37_14337 [Capsicum annuum]KAF3675666.1 hypothetical protein FXO38_04673 [Capsicum annuum]